MIIDTERAALLHTMADGPSLSHTPVPDTAALRSLLRSGLVDYTWTSNGHVRPQLTTEGRAARLAAIRQGIIR